MPERDGYMPGVPCWVDTSQPDPEAAVAFYGVLFSWQFENVMPPGSEVPYFIGRIRGGDVAAVSSTPPGGPPIATWNTYIWVDSADETAAKATSAGGTVLMEPYDVLDSGRIAMLADPEGASFALWQAKQHKGARIVNEHGSLNFNGLNTRDPEAAKPFYKDVFGWGTLSMGPGAAMWTLPGYGDALEAANPGLRDGMAAMGAPAEFADVVAAITPLGEDRANVPPHWDVTFAVDDADATASKAAELGGTVVVPPFDAPWVRMTVIADPGGATFIASQFVEANKNLAGVDDATARTT